GFLALRGQSSSDAQGGGSVVARPYGSVVPVVSGAIGSLGIEIDDPALEAAVVSRLAAVEEQIRDVVYSKHPLVAEAARHLGDAGGTGLRPLLVALAAEFGSDRGTEVRDAAIVVELTHLATLYHDDVMDEAVVRRGAVSANSRWGNSVAILVGDYLFARAATVAASLGP